MKEFIVVLRIDREKRDLLRITGDCLNTNDKGLYVMKNDVPVAFFPFGTFEYSYEVTV